MTEISGCSWLCLKTWGSVFYPQGKYSFHPAVLGWVVFHLQGKEWENEVCFAARWSWLTHAVSLPEMQCDDSTNIQEKKPKGIHVSGQITPEKIEWSSPILVPITSCDCSQTQYAWKIHLAADALRTWYSNDITGYKWRRDSRREKYFIFPRDWLTMKA